MLTLQQIRNKPKVREYEQALIAHAIRQKERDVPHCYYLHPNVTRQLAVDMGLLHYPEALKGWAMLQGRILADILYNNGLAAKLNRIFTKRYGRLTRTKYFDLAPIARRKITDKLALEKLSDGRFWTLD